MPTIIPSDVATAVVEIQQKTRAEIETETAKKWGARACAAYQLFTRDNDTRWLNDAIEYAHEAVEHAAAAEEAGGEPGTVASVRATTDAARKTVLGW